MSVVATVVSAGTTMVSVGITMMPVGVTMMSVFALLGAPGDRRPVTSPVV